MEHREEGIASVRKTLQLIELLSANNGAMTVTQLSEALDCSISSVNRFLQTMQAEGYVEKSAATNKYCLSNQIFRVCNRLLQNNRSLRGRVCQDDFCKFSKFKYLSAEKSPNISCLHIS